MRTAWVVMVAAAAACGDDDGTSVRQDGRLVDGKAIDAPADANLDISGTWLDKYVSAGGSSVVPSCNIAPTAVVLDQVTGAITTYPGTCKTDGTFRIMTAATLGTYYLRLGNTFLETNKRSDIDLSIEHLGRADLGAVASASLNIDMTNMAPWAAGNALIAFAPNNGYIQPLSITPATNATAVQGTASWTGYKVDAAKADTVQLIQLGAHQTGGGLSYQTLDRSFDAPAFTMANNTTSAIAGAFTTTTTKTQQVRVNVASFNAFASSVNPNITGRTIEGTMYASPSADALRSPALFAFTANATGVAATNFGTVSYVDPYPAAWPRLVRIQEAYTVAYTSNNVTGALNAIASRILPASTVDTTVVDAVLGPPTSPTFDAVDAFTATHISPVVKVSWSPPSLGTPTDYEIQVYDVTIEGTTLKFTSVLRLMTKLTSTRIPAGMLLGARHYVFAIRARIRENVDIYGKPLRAGDTSSSAEVLTALVTTDV